MDVRREKRTAPSTSLRVGGNGCATGRTCWLEVGATGVIAWPLESGRYALVG
jgi:hypothetical protein